MADRIERERGQEQVQELAAEEAPVVLGHMAFELAVRSAEELPVSLIDGSIHRIWRRS